LKGKKTRFVLVADDQAMNQSLFSMVLEKLGYDFILAADGLDAVEKTSKNNPALVFMDVQMPIMNGYEAAKKLRDLGFSMPIIAVTAGTYLEEYENCSKAGINDILIKPCKSSDIKMMLKKWTEAGDRAVSMTEPAVTSKAKNSVFEAADMLDTFLNNEKTALPLLSRFIERTKSQLENIPDLEKTGDWEVIRNNAHMISGASLTMSGSELGNAAALLEQAAEKMSKSEVNAAYIAVNKAFADFKREAEAFISSRS
jgi:CheY-like chemotaxis protein